MNNVIHCAQERLNDLQNQVLQYHEMNVKLTKQLTFVKICQQEILCKLGEGPKNDVCESQVHPAEESRIERNTCHGFHCYPPSIFAYSACEFRQCQGNSHGCTYVNKRLINCSPKHQWEDSSKHWQPFEKSDYSNKITANNDVYCKDITSNNNGDNLKSQLDNTSNLQEVMKLRKQILIIYESYQCHYQDVLKKLKTHQYALNDQVSIQFTLHKRLVTIRLNVLLSYQLTL
ncbi:unnamed protein product [Schistosoma curassoni]|uniref:EB domain-containing protein n=1 Tax=Schistosoma curassoni TaxID=6186 RepID=A0A183JXK9_9TREM|nr:unnamed protein product [Schistosoma curassoni]